MEPTDNTPYKLRIFYYNPADKRVLVPKRNAGTGWTVNFARWWSWLIMGLLSGVVIWSVTR